MKESSAGNLISNYASRLWTLISVFIFIPVYIHYLGIEYYAIVGFYSLLLGIVSFADAGLSSVIIKEFSVNSTPSYKYSLLLLIERVYILVCISLAIILVFFSELIAKKWLVSETIPIHELKKYIQLIGVCIPIQLSSSLYFGALFGLNYQVKANILQIVWNVFKSGFVVIVLALSKGSLVWFFVWQIICNLIYVLTLRYNVKAYLQQQSEKLIICLTKIPAPVLKYIGSMTLIAVISSINLQADKIITSSLFSLKVFGYYSIASTLSQIPMIMATPLSISVFPLLSQSSNNINQEKFVTTYKKSTFLLHIIVFPVAFCMCLYTSEVLRLWTGSTVSSIWFDRILVVIRLLVIGSTFLALQLLPFYVLLAKGKTKYTFYQGLSQVLIGLPLLYFSVKKFGLIGAGIPWIFINAAALAYLYFIVFKRYISLSFTSFLKNTIAIPFAINFVIVFSFYILYRETLLPFYLFPVLSGIFSVGFNILFLNLKNNKPYLDIKTHLNFSHE
jgi:O-antigen/teichoic acid export membrane protein